MVKKTEKKLYPIWLLFLMASILISAGWLMKSLPLLIFIGYAPLFAISDHAKDRESPWNHLEVILLIMIIALLSAHIFNFEFIILILAQSIILTMVFAGYAFTYQSLGSRISIFTVVIFWLALEYLMLKLPWREQFIFLADALIIHPDWSNWNIKTGYLTNSLWILLVNLFFYLALFKKNQVNWYLAAAASLLIMLPIGYSYWIEKDNGLLRVEMIRLYNNSSEEDNDYSKHGELIGRTAAWLSILILLLSLVKNKIKK